MLVFVCELDWSSINTRAGLQEPGSCKQHTAQFAFHVLFDNLCFGCTYLQVFWAFMLDMVLFYIWQLSFLQAAPAQYKYLPYFGLAGWLIAGGTAADAEDA
jgi:hypothetical protein